MFQLNELYRKKNMPRKVLLGFKISSQDPAIMFIGLTQLAKTGELCNFSIPDILLSNNNFRTSCTKHKAAKDEV